MIKQDLKQITKIMKAIADESRIRILCLLKNRKALCVCEITELIGLAQPTISSHLKLLENAGLIESYKDGLWVNYNITGNFDSFRMQLIETIYSSLLSDSQIKADKEKMGKINRESLCKKQR